MATCVKEQQVDGSQPHSLYEAVNDEFHEQNKVGVKVIKDDSDRSALAPAACKALLICRGHLHALHD